MESVSEPLERFRRGGPRDEPDEVQDPDAFERSRARTRATRWALAGGMAVLAFGTAIVFAIPPQGQDTADDDTATSQPVSLGPEPLTRPQATEACLRDVAAELGRRRALLADRGVTSPPHGSPEVLLAHPRDGEYVFVVVDGASISHCQFRGSDSHVLSYLTTDYVRTPEADTLSFDHQWFYGAGDVTRIVLAGRVGADVESVVLELADGTQVPAPVRLGAFAATWTRVRGETGVPRVTAVLQDGSHTERRLDL